MKTLVVLSAMALLAVGCGPANGPATSSTPASASVVVANGPVDSYGTSQITGRVIFRGTAPKPVVIQMKADPYCESMHTNAVTSQDLLINEDGTLKNVFVYVKQGLTGAYTAPHEPALVVQEGCNYRPRVQGLRVGQPLLIRNEDETLHNVHALAEVNEPFNLAQATRGMESKRVFAQPEVMLHFKCDVHPWMSCYLGILPHPFYGVTGNDGAFALAKLPAGEYVVEAWQEKLGTQQQKVMIGPDETKTIEFVFSN